MPLNAKEIFENFGKGLITSAQRDEQMETLQSLAMLKRSVVDTDRGLANHVQRYKNEALRTHSYIQLKNIKKFVTGMDCKGHKLSIGVYPGGMHTGLMVDGCMYDPSNNSGVREKIFGYDENDQEHGDYALQQTFDEVAQVIEQAGHDEWGWYLKGWDLN